MIHPSLAQTSNTTARHSPRQIAGIPAALALPALIGALIGGCARGVATTTVHTNGSWVRSVSYHGVKAAKDGSVGMGTSINDAFVLPSGAGWKVTHADTKDEAVVVAERSLQPGESLHGDITVKGDKENGGMPVATNTVTVETTAPGVFKYTEILHWKGPVPKNLVPDAEMLAAFKTALPPGLATDANAGDLAKQSIRDLWGVLFGPGDPLVSQISSLLTEPELAERRVQQRIGAALEQHMEARFGTRMTPAQRRTAAAAIIHNSLFNLSSQTKNSGPGGDPTNKDNSPPPTASLFIDVKLPGKITSTNGERDDVDGDVFWSLYPEAAAIGDVTLTATCDTNAK